MTTRKQKRMTTKGACDGRDPVCTILLEHYPDLHHTVHTKNDRLWLKLKKTGGVGLPRLLDALLIESTVADLHEVLAMAVLFGAYLGGRGQNMTLVKSPASFRKEDK